MKTLVIGDLHIREEEPFYSTSLQFLDWIKYLVESKDRIILLGDVFHRSKPSPPENTLFSSFIDWCFLNSVTLTVLQGNHDYSEHHKYFSTDLFKDKILIIDRPSLEKFDKHNFLFLPWIPKGDLQDYKSLKDFYENEIFFENESSKKTYLMYHFPDETVEFGGNTGINLSRFEDQFKDVIRLGGDIHINRYKNYVGTPYPTRYDERNQNGQIFSINERGDLEKLDTPIFLQYKDVDYKNLNKLLEFNDEVKKILTIDNAPSKLVEEEINYPNVWIRKINLESSIERTVSSETSMKKNIKEVFTEFSTINKIDDSTKSYILEKL